MMNNKEETASLIDQLELTLTVIKNKAPMDVLYLLRCETNFEQVIVGLKAEFAWKYGISYKDYKAKEGK